MYDELVKRLRKCALDMAEDCVGCPYRGGYKETCCMNGLILKAADAIEELSKPRWISVAERFPEHAFGEGDSVLTLSCLGTMRVLYFDGGNWCYPTGEAVNTARKFPITHWMPLPEPPKEADA